MTKTTMFGVHKTMNEIIDRTTIVDHTLTHHACTLTHSNLHFGHGQTYGKIPPRECNASPRLALRHPHTKREKTRALLLPRLARKRSKILHLVNLTRTSPKIIRPNRPQTITIHKKKPTIAPSYPVPLDVEPGRAGPVDHPRKRTNNHGTVCLRNCTRMKLAPPK